MSTESTLRIGDAAAILGIEAHVLRHWESVGLLHPPRTPSGHRTYNQQTLDIARLIRILQRTGLSLEQIRDLGANSSATRITLIETRRAEIRARMALLEATDSFLAHLTTCSHPLIADCPECSKFSRLTPPPHLDTPIGNTRTPTTTHAPAPRSESAGIP
ncbi:MerR family transcriptional regulator [Nocardia jiangxiensis]|uniref:MerR family transcriptional regulator n=1 Tax=Nocardia jiangxiensis TaxID=282685 RepID=A0ABW6S9P1_9NOCA|nr:MerR family transcriptional regulator [Nocardia jiangxiensis]